MPRKRQKRRTPPEPPASQPVSPPQMVAPGVEVQSVVMDDRSLLVRGLVTGRNSGPRVVAYRTPWVVLEELAQASRQELMTGFAFLGNRACRVNLATSLLTAYGVVTMKEWM